MGGGCLSAPTSAKSAGYYGILTGRLLKIRAQTGLILGPLITMVIAAVLVIVLTLARALLNPVLGSLSPFMLYVFAVLVAGLVRSSACGVLVMIGSGLCGYYLFVEPQNSWDLKLPGLIALLVFWLVSGLVLLAARALRPHLWDPFQKYVELLELER